MGERSQFTAWYQLASWKKRRKHQLMVEPLCRMCAKEGKTVPATIVDHIEPHRGDYNKFRLTPLQSLCVGHHNRYKQRMEVIGYAPDVGEDGWPLDKNHPSNIALAKARKIDFA
jgi:hypothetical protein